MASPAKAGDVPGLAVVVSFNGISQMKFEL
jgi:hypothetical protein